MADAEARISQVEAQLARLKAEAKAKKSAKDGIAAERVALLQLETDEGIARGQLLKARATTIAQRKKVHAMEFLLGERKVMRKPKTAPTPEAPGAATPEPGGGDNADQT